VRPDQSSATVRCHYLTDGTVVFAFTMRKSEYFIPAGILLKCFLEVRGSPSDKCHEQLRSPPCLQLLALPPPSAGGFRALGTRSSRSAAAGCRLPLRLLAARLLHVPYSGPSLSVSVRSLMPQVSDRELFAKLMAGAAPGSGPAAFLAERAELLLRQADARDLRTRTQASGAGAAGEGEGWTGLGGEHRRGAGRMGRCGEAPGLCLGRP
jgi:hypothetical protein